MLALEDGTVFEGTSFGAQGEAYGEVVFNTSLMGYQEVLNDPSYKGQIVTMTYPLIGNYGVNEEDYESDSPKVEGFVVRELSRVYSNYRSNMSLDQYLKKYNVVGIQGIDTRALTLHIRTKGAMKAVISTEDHNPKRLVEKAKNSEGLVGRDLVKEVTTPVIYDWDKEDKESPPWETEHKKGTLPEAKYHVVAFDFGVKRNILRRLRQTGCRVTVVPADTPVEKVLELKPDGIFLSNGPGDPSAVPYASETVKQLIGKFPIFGICLGHQILSLAMGAKTYKLKFGHRGGNQPAMNEATGRVEISVQNHGFAVDPESLKGLDLQPTHFNLNDKTNEGVRHKTLPIFSVQHHPEASPGPHDSAYLFEDFVKLMEANKKN